MGILHRRRRNPHHGKFPVGAIFGAVTVTGLLHATSVQADVTDFAFGEPEVIDLPAGFSPSCIEFSDHDGDGDLDAVVTGRNSEQLILVLEGEPGGLFSVAGEIEAPDQIDWVETRDLDGDGDLDMVVAVRTPEGLIAVYDGAEDGSFPDEPRLFSVGREVRNVHIEDINADGALDLVSLGHVSEDVSILLGDGTGEFELTDRIRLAPWKNGFVFPQSASIVDLDADGALDVVSVSIGARSLHISRGRGDGTMNRTRAWLAPEVNGEAGGCAYVSIADFDSDGLFECIAPQTTWGQQWVILFEVDATGTITSSTPVIASPWGISWISDAADFDSDGDIDLCIGHALPGVVVFMENVTEPGAETTFLDPQWFFTGEFIRYTHAQDIDLDGDEDLIALDYTGDAILIFRNMLAEGFVAGDSSKRNAAFSRRSGDLPGSLRGLDGWELGRRLSEMSAREARALGEQLRAGKPEASR